MTSPRVTIQMPVRNGMPFVTETLESIAAQTYGNLEILAWDNGSTDGTVDELHRWIPARIPGRVVDDRPMPLGRCRRQMMHETETERVALCDADDIHLPRRIELQVAFLQAHPDCGLVGTNAQCVDEQLRPLDRQFTLPASDAEIRWRMLFANALLQGTSMVRRSRVLAAGNYRPIQPGQDYDLMMRMTPLCEMANLPERLMLYRIRRDSISHDAPTPGVKVNRDLFARYLDRLLPGVDPAAILQTHRKLTTDFNASVSLADIRTLHRAAGALARACGRPDDYFRRTDRYARQKADLKARWVKGLPLVRAAWARAKAAHHHRLPARRAA